jgi:Domain of Unknown Function (DUF1080)
LEIAMKNASFIVLASSVVLFAAASFTAYSYQAPATPAPAPAAAQPAAPATAPAAGSTTTPASTNPAAMVGEAAGGEWKSANNVVTQSNSDTPALLLFGDKTWKDYTLELEGQKTDGDEGFLIPVRAKDDVHLVWFNVGGWGNTRTAFEGVSGEDKTDWGDGQTYSDFVEVQTGKWHKLKVVVSGKKVEGFIDGKSACKATTDDLPAGRVGVGTWSTQAKFRNIKVTAPDGKVLWEGTPTVAK